MFKKVTNIIPAILSILLLFPTIAYGDVAVGESVVTLGKDLNSVQEKSILREFNISNSTAVIEVTNTEEHKYLGKYISKAMIGSRAISSAKITILDSGKGISVKTNNITNITSSMYANAAITAGIKDVDIFVTAPFKVSGTAGLTGIIKAFETATGQKIAENKKLVANEEIVRTSEIAKEIGDPNKAAQFMNKVKEEVAKQNPQTVEDFKNVITNISNQFNFQPNQETMNQLIQFSQNFSNLNIDWDLITRQLDSLRGDIGNILNHETTKSLFNTVLDWMGTIFSSIGGLFSTLADSFQEK